MKLACEKCEKVIDACFKEKYETITADGEKKILCKDCYKKLQNFLYEHSTEDELENKAGKQNEGIDAIMLDEIIQSFVQETQCLCCSTYVECYREKRRSECNEWIRYMIIAERIKNGKVHVQCRDYIK